MLRLLKFRYWLLAISYWLLAIPFPSPTLALETDELYIHPESVEEIAAGYKVTCADAPLSNIKTNNLNFCLGGCVTSSLKEEVEYVGQDDNVKIPWFNQEAEVKLETSYDQRVGSGAKFWSANPITDPNDPDSYPEDAAPFYHGTTTQSQCLAKLRYLEHINTLCQNQSPCLLPRLIPLNPPYDPATCENDDRSDCINDLDFYQSKLQNVSCDTYHEDLSEADLKTFDAIIPQIRDGVEFKKSYWLSYVKEPEGPKIEISFERSPVVIGDFLTPVTNVGGQTNQKNYLKFGQVPDYQYSFTDSLFTRAGNILLPLSAVEKREANFRERQDEQYAKVMNCSTQGPHVNAGDFCQTITEDNAIECSLIKLVNCQDKVCKQSDGGERSQITYTEARFFDVLKQTFFSIISPFQSGEGKVAEFNYIISAEETQLIRDTTDEVTLSTFYPHNQWSEIKDNETFTPFNEIESKRTTSKDPKCYFSILGLCILQFPEDSPFATVGLNTQDEQINASITGRGAQASITKIAGNILRLYQDPSSLKNSGCEEGGEESDCYWKKALEDTPGKPGGGQCLAPQPYSPELSSLITQAKSKFPDGAVHHVPTSVLEAIYSIEATVAYADPSSYTCQPNYVSAKGLMAVTDSAYAWVVPPSQRFEDTGVCTETKGKLSRCYPVDAIEIAARVLLVKVGMWDFSTFQPTGSITTKIDVYNASCAYFGTWEPTDLTNNLADRLDSKFLYPPNHPNADTLTYCEYVCAKSGYCNSYSDYPPRP